MRIVLSIAGSDCSGGAGIQADLKTFEAHGVYGATVITAVTAQNATAVSDIRVVEPEHVEAQLRAVAEGFPVDAIKVGMLASAETAKLIGEFAAKRWAGVPIVVDPVMTATTGTSLVGAGVVDSLTKYLLPRATVITPNPSEAERLAGRPIQSLAEMVGACEQLCTLGSRYALITGGDLTSDMWRSGSPECCDLLGDGRRWLLYRSPRIGTGHKHGTGCTMSSAIAANLAQGLSVEYAVLHAKNYIVATIRRAPDICSENGPLRHSPGCSATAPSPLAASSILDAIDVARRPGS